ncbi:superoxide dismutase family protein [uncultured Shewanella sp.]|uniref:superoxide dismutase family protein n=1 Tax=uncultured Shewanella sp. TaxID=173975 RepID=UPI00261FAC05|nr:superoxide dismutase family protein [uncultured Shewanella sp.]
MTKRPLTALLGAIMSVGLVSTSMASSMSAVNTHEAVSADIRPLNQQTEKIMMSTVTSDMTAHSVGYITAKDTPEGLLLTPHLVGIPTGFHGFHVHTQPSCADNGHAAGGHLDPQKTNVHLGPYGNGHLGDLPVLYANQQDQISGSVIAPKLTLAKLKGHSLMIHLGGDNYSDNPAKLGGGGTRFACGVIK